MEFGVDLAASVMVSLEGERVPLLKSVPTVPTEGKVEVWLSQVGVVVARARGCATTCVVCGQVEAVMKSTMASCVRRSLDDLSTSTRTEWAQRWPGSVVLAVSDIVWTSDVESALRSTRLSFQGAGLSCVVHRGCTRPQPPHRGPHLQTCRQRRHPMGTCPRC